MVGSTRTRISPGTIGFDLVIVFLGPWAERHGARLTKRLPGEPSWPPSTTTPGTSSAL